MDRNHLHQLVDKLNSGQLSADERQELMDYYNSYQWSSAWDASYMGEEAVVKAELFARIQENQYAVESRKGRSMSFYIRIAASLLLIGVFSWMTYVFVINKEELVVVSTGKETKEILLPDGSKITLNVNSSVSYPVAFAGNSRQVTFSGEGFFEVQSDSLHPFIVSTPQVKIRVLGTTFNLKAYQEDPAVETSLIHGKVEVLKADDGKVLSTLKPNEKIVVKKEHLNSNKNKVSMPKISIQTLDFLGDDDLSSPVDVAWKDGKFAFVSMPLQDIGREMKRRYGVEIKIENAEIANNRYSATFEKEGIDEMLRALILVKPFSYRKEGSIIVIY
ncbi:FecR family protein [Sphingobacterium chungjuense]|uniref:FecR family protein n=1 Tax=Sphingobacterium chungjuense TaxID=2675553 RepID=UPI00140AA52A|nr:FecR domain-containing protein [Sphingobacterium chungjuense]